MQNTIDVLLNAQWKDQGVQDILNEEDTSPMLQVRKHEYSNEQFKDLKIQLQLLKQQLIHWILNKESFKHIVSQAAFCDVLSFSCCQLYAGCEQHLSSREQLTNSFDSHMSLLDVLEDVSPLAVLYYLQRFHGHQPFLYGHSTENWS